MEFTVCLDQFEGPLDLMLHLVRSSKLDLFELNLDVLATQYIEYIHQAINQALDVRSEYLVEFSTLLEYKSRKLLPRSEPQVDEAGNPPEDPAKELARRLREYEQLKKQSEAMEKLAAAREKRLDREPSRLIGEWSATPVEQEVLSMSTDLLQKAFLRVLRRHKILSPYQTRVEVSELSVETRMAQILNLECFGETAVPFEKLLEGMHTLHEFVVTFLAVLELVHDGAAAAWVDDTEGEEIIWIQQIRTNH